MKTRIIVQMAAIVFLLASSACKKALPDITFDKEYASLDFIIPEGDNVGELIVDIAEVNADIKARLEQDGFNLNNLKSVTLKSARLEILNPETSFGGNPVDFDFVRSSEVYLVNEFSTLGIASVELPEFYPARSIDLEAANFDLRNFFRKDFFTVRSRVVMELPRLLDYQVRAKLVFTIKAGI